MNPSNETICTEQSTIQLNMYSNFACLWNYFPFQQTSSSPLIFQSFWCVQSSQKIWNYKTISLNILKDVKINRLRTPSHHVYICSFSRCVYPKWLTDEKLKKNCSKSYSLIGLSTLNTLTITNFAITCQLTLVRVLLDCNRLLG